MPRLICRFGRSAKKNRYSRLRLERRGFLSVYSFAVSGPERRLEMMDRGPSVVVLPVDFRQRELYLIKQPRPVKTFVETAAGRQALRRARRGLTGAAFTLPASRASSLGLPAGMIEDGETPAQAASRELAEETGWLVSPADLTPDVKFYNSIGGSTETTDGFIAELGPKTRQVAACGDGQEIASIWKYSWDEAFALLDRGRINSASAIIMLERLRRRERRR